MLLLHSTIVVLVHLALLGVGVVLSIIDARTHRLPDRIVLPTLAALWALLLVDLLLTGEQTRAGRAMLGMLCLVAFYAALRMLSRSGMGGGDVKLAAVVGLVLAWHGWTTLLIGSAAAFVLGAAYALTRMAMRRATRSTRIAFGPWMIAGAALAVLVG